ncbi:hypothetical protein [Streptomyces sp. NBC_00691]|uniref:hypothetical protein n=1 Tax=Streptomyces sp. NBC_00691 TaxID=2903671 RepID=UPI002E364E1D|nr:hypothetical protein [Streptomyces sp. NBC_00691]
MKRYACADERVLLPPQRAEQERQEADLSAREDVAPCGFRVVRRFRSAAIAGATAAIV